MNRHTRTAAALLGAAALLLPASALAKGKPEDKPAKPSSSRPASYVFKGVWHAATGTVTVSGGNARVRKGGFVGQDVGFDLTATKLRVADSNADGLVDAADVMDGDKVVVKARLPRTEPGTGPFAARMLVDQTHPAVEAEEDAD